MGKNRNKRKNAGMAPMDTSEQPASALPEAMDTSETGAAPSSAADSLHRKVRGVQMKRTKSLRKKKALAKAISRFEMVSEKVSKTESKKLRVKSAKSLYD